MKKVFVAVIIVLLFANALPVQARYEPIEKAFEIRTMPDRTQVLYTHGKPYKGTRIHMLAQVRTMLGQPQEKYLLLLNHDGTGTGLGKPDNRFLLLQNPKTGRWQVIAESYRLNGTIIGASDPGKDLHDVTVVVQDLQPQTVELVSVQKPF